MQIRAKYVLLLCCDSLWEQKSCNPKEPRLRGVGSQKRLKKDYQGTHLLLFGSIYVDRIRSLHPLGLGSFGDIRRRREFSSSTLVL